MVCEDCRWYWVAAVIDCEGTISIGICKHNAASKKGKRLRLTPWIVVGARSEALVTLLRDLTGCGRIRLKDAKKNFWTWRVDDVRRCKVLLERIGDAFVVKKEQARLLLEFCKSRVEHPFAPYTDKEKQIAKQIRELNAREKAYEHRKYAVEALAGCSGNR